MKNPKLLEKLDKEKISKFNLNDWFDFQNKQVEDNYNGKINTWVTFWMTSILIIMVIVLIQYSLTLKILVMIIQVRIQEKY